MRLSSLARGKREQEMLGGHVLVFESRHLVEGGHEHVAQRAADRRLPATVLFGTRLELGLQTRGQRLGGDLAALGERGHKPILLMQQGKKEVLRLDGGVLKRRCRLLSSLK